MLQEQQKIQRANSIAWLGSLAALPWLALASVAYFAAARLLQDRLYAQRDWAAEYGTWFSGFHLRPEPYETPVYLLGFLIIPILATAAHVAWQKKAVRWLAFGAGILGVIAVVGKFLPKLGAFATKLNPTVAFDYLQRRGLGHAIWLALTKRTFLNIVLITSAVVFTLLAAWWLNQRRRAQLQAAWQKLSAKRWPAWTPLMVIVALAAILWHPNLPYEEHHYGYWLGPANDQLHGKQWLVETNSQYGLLSHLTLVGIFTAAKNVSYEWFSIINQASFLLYFIGLYLLLRQWLRSELAAIGGLAMLMAATYWPMITPTITAYDYPGLSPFRFGLSVPAALLWLAYLRMQKPWLKRLHGELFLAVGGLAPLWNIDSGAYLAATVAAVTVLETTVWASEAWVTKLRRAAGRLLRQAAYGALGLTAVSLGVWLTSHAWPNWGAVLAEVATYTSGRALNPLPLVGGFLVFIVGYLAAGLWAQRQTQQGQVTTDVQLVTFLGIYGVLSLNYYIGNSAWNLLFPVCGPLVLLWIYFSHQWLLHSRRRWVIAAVTASVALAALVWAVKVPVELGHRRYAAGVQPRPVDAALQRDANRLRAEYASLPRLPLVHTRGAKLLILAEKANALAFYDLTQLYFHAQMDAVIAAARQHDTLFVGVDPDPQVAYFRQHALADYVRLDHGFETLDVYTRATSTPPQTR